MNKVKLLPDIYPHEIKLELTEQTRETAWRKTATLISDTSHYRAYLNLLASITYLFTK